MLFIPLDERVGLARIGRRGAARADVSTPDPIRRFREISAEQLTASRTGLIAIYESVSRATPGHRAFQMRQASRRTLRVKVDIVGTLLRA
jgi:hypothetical protein